MKKPLKWTLWAVAALAVGAALALGGLGMFAACLWTARRESLRA